MTELRGALVALTILATAVSASLATAQTPPPPLTVKNLLDQGYELKTTVYTPPGLNGPNEVGSLLMFFQKRNSLYVCIPAKTGGMACDPYAN